MTMTSGPLAIAPRPIQHVAAAHDRLDPWPYSTAVRAERLLAVARTVLALFGLLTTFVDPAEPAKYAHTFYVLLAGYAAYSLALLLVVWTSTVPVKPLQVLTQAVDLGLYTLFIYLTDGFTSPVFAFLVFSVLCAAVRWQGRGALVAATAAILAFIFLGLYFYVLPPRDPAFELDRFIFRAVYLAVVAGVVTSIGIHQGRIRRELGRLAAWPRPLAADRGDLLGEVLAHAAGILAAPRVVLVLEESEEPWREVASWSSRGCQVSRVPPDRYSPPVAEAFERLPFMCRDASAPEARVLVASAEGLRERRGPAIDERLRSDFSMHSVLALPLDGEMLTGWLFYLDKRQLSTDDVALGTITAREIIRSLSQAEMMEVERQSAVSDERTRLGRDLHDGLLQSLTAARLQLHHLSRQAAPGSESREKLHAVEASIAANQRELRRLVEELRPRDDAREVQPATLAQSLAGLRARLRQEWELEVRAAVDSCIELPPTLAREVYLMVHEALVNAARHGGATVADVSVAVERQRLSITITDNGRGFPFEGRRDALQLAAEHAGPVSLRERVVSLDGVMVIDSGPAGARVELTIPLEPGA